MPDVTPGLLIVGGGVAGVRAAESARRSGYDGAITVLGGEPHHPYDRTSLSKGMLTTDGPDAPPVLRDAEGWAELDVDFRTGVTATGLDTARRTVTTTSGPVQYDALVIATGGRARTLTGLDGLPMREWDDARRIRAALDSGGHILVVGAGFIGGEVATAARDRGLDVTVIDAAPLPLGRAVGDVGGKALAAVHEAGGVDLRLGTTISQVRGDDVTLSDGTTLTVSAVICGIGAVPASEWLVGSDVALDTRTGAVVADATLATSVPDVWVAGDLALVDGHLGQHWTAADAQGRLAGVNAVSPSHEPWQAIAFAWSHWYGHRVQYVGSCVGDAELVVHQDGPSATILVRSGERLAGVLAIDRPADAAKARRLLTAGTDWSAAVEAFETAPQPG